MDASQGPLQEPQNEILHTNRENNIQVASFFDIAFLNNSPNLKASPFNHHDMKKVFIGNEELTNNNMTYHSLQLPKSPQITDHLDLPTNIDK